MAESCNDGGDVDDVGDDGKRKVNGEGRAADDYGDNDILTGLRVELT